MIIEIPDRLYNDISSWCHANEKLPVQWYILHSLSEKFMIDKYGDLNEKFKKKAVFKLEKPDDLPSTPLDEETEPKQQTPEVHIPPQEKESEPVQHTVEEPESVSETVEKQVEPVKKKRTLKTK